MGSLTLAEQDRLLADPTQLMPAYLASAQGQSQPALARAP